MDSDKIPQDRRLTARLESGHLVVHTDVDEPNVNRTLGLGVTIDVNEFGIKVQAAEAMPLGEKFRFSLALGDLVVDARGQVVHISRCLNGTFEMGIEFLDIAAPDIEALRRFAAEHGTE